MQDDANSTSVDAGEDEASLDDLDPYFAQQLNRNKERVVIKDSSTLTINIKTLLDKLYTQNPSSNIIFASNWDETKLNAMGLSDVALHAMHSRLIYVLLSPWGALSDITANKKLGKLTDELLPQRQGKYSSEGAAREWSTVVIVIVIFINWLLFECLP